jgi:hypothetical protein
MRWLLTLLMIVCSPTLVLADHFYPSVGQEVQVGAWCNTISDMEAMVLSEFPNPIPDDIDCWLSSVPLKGIIIAKVGEIGAYDILEIGNLTSVFSGVILHEAGIYLPVLRDDKDV